MLFYCLKLRKKKQKKQKVKTQWFQGKGRKYQNMHCVIVNNHNSSKSKKQVGYSTT